MLAFLAAPFVASLILTGIHAYLGVHLVERGVIFVDLSLAQIAALGATIALLTPWSTGDPHAPYVYWISLLFTFIGAAVFSFIRARSARIPQEAIIGICYAVASAAAILAMSKATSESEHLKEMLVQYPRGVVGRSARNGCAVRGGWPVSLSVPATVPGNLDRSGTSGSQRAVAQVLGFSVLRLLWFRRDLVGLDRGRSSRLLLPHRALGRGYVVRRHHRASFSDRLDDGHNRLGSGVYLSLKLDLPTGATIVCTFGLVLILMAAVRPLLQRKTSHVQSTIHN
jgi:zinc/manganese transport system permease protein